jgi:hypothetical protein
MAGPARDGSSGPRSFVDDRDPAGARRRGRSTPCARLCTLLGEMSTLRTTNPLPGGNLDVQAVSDPMNLTGDLARNAIPFGDAEPRDTKPPPGLGEHSDALRAWLESPL